MLSSGKFPRFAIFVAILLAGILVGVLRFVHDPSRSLLFSNCLDLAMVLWAALCSFSVARCSSGYARQLWTLLAIALALETIAQAVSTYYQSFVPGSAGIPWPSDVLFFVWAAPVLMMFLPQSEQDSPGIDWLRLLDFTQVGIVAATAYLYFFYVPSHWQSNQAGLVRQILTLYITRDLLLSLAFFLRSRTSLSWLRFFSFSLGFVFLAAAFSDGDYLLTLGTFAGGASWGDLLWMLPYFLVVILSALWKPAHPSLLTAPRSRFGDIAVTHVLPIAIPLLVIFMGRRIAHEQLLIAWLAVSASFLCSALRLILTNRKQRSIGKELRFTEQALRRSERMFSSAFRWSPDAFSINVFPDGSYLDVNEGFTRLTGFTRDETLNKTPRQMNLLLDPSHRAQIMSRLTETGEIREEEFRFRTKTGQLRTGQMSAALVDLDGQRCALIVVRDVTARKEAENILRTSEERFRSLVENLHVGIVSYGPDGKILFANQALQDMTGMKLDRLFGKNLGDLQITPFLEDGTPLPRNLLPVPYVISTRQPLRNQLLGWQSPRRQSMFWTLLDAVPEFDAQGELLRVIVSVTNLTEQRRATEALRESEERFRTLVQDLHVAVVLHDPDARIQFANRAAAELFGFPVDYVIGKQVRELNLTAVDEDGREIPFEELPIPTILRTHAPVRNRVIGFRRAGSPDILWIFGNATPQFDKNGSLIRVISSFSDISQMKNAERAIHQLSTQLLNLQDEERRRIGRELHDGLAQTVLAINLSLAQVRQSLLPLDEAAGRALEKARGLLQQLSREIRTLSYLLHPPLLDDLGLVSALKEYAHGFSERSCIDTQLFLLTDFGRLPQPAETALFRIVQECLANIQRHSGSATAKIRLRQENSMVVLEVTDYGRGMKLPSNGAPQPGEAHLGVGIHGMRERMAQLGGRLEIDSGPTGTTVRATILIPAAVSRKTDDAAPAHPHR